MAFHPQTDGQSKRTIRTLEDMLRACVIDLGVRWDHYLPLMEFAYNNSFQASIQMAPFEALYGQRCKSPIGWLEEIERKLLGPELVSPTKRVLRFGNKGKLSPRYVDLCEILEKIRAVAYRLALLLDLSNIYPVFHVSMLRKYNLDPSHVIRYETIQLRDDLTYEEQLMVILDKQVKKLHSKDVASVKVLCETTPLKR
ncbi:PREDICTED: uncharacterized protein LOC108661166 [Theobroma cacao]|uniref:Uncharacterized protein LOC108661166 n=1 Tax=Theobroma cacao TaxID=3641 RepID=A0AB32W384_THECC|nr:PREDICTED: uncharacterized protein LOC108661166 [Theobroma cacao]